MTVVSTERRQAIGVLLEAIQQGREQWLKSKEALIQPHRRALPNPHFQHGINTSGEAVQAPTLSVFLLEKLN